MSDLHLEFGDAFPIFTAHTRYCILAGDIVNYKNRHLIN